MFGRKVQDFVKNCCLKTSSINHFSGCEVIRLFIITLFISFLSHLFIDLSLHQLMLATSQALNRILDICTSHTTISMCENYCICLCIQK